MLDDDAPLASSTRDLLRLAAAAQGQGLITAVRWGLAPAMQSAVDNAIRAKEWEAKVQGGVGPHPRTGRARRGKSQHCERRTTGGSR